MASDEDESHDLFLAEQLFLIDDGVTGGEDEVDFIVSANSVPRKETQSESSDDKPPPPLSEEDLENPQANPSELILRRSTEPSLEFESPPAAVPDSATRDEAPQHDIDPIAENSMERIAELEAELARARSNLRWYAKAMDAIYERNQMLLPEVDIKLLQESLNRAQQFGLVEDSGDLDSDEQEGEQEEEDEAEWRNIPIAAKFLPVYEALDRVRESMSEEDRNKMFYSRIRKKCVYQQKQSEKRRNARVPPVPRLFSTKGVQSQLTNSVTKANRFIQRHAYEAGINASPSIQFVGVDTEWDFRKFVNEERSVMSLVPDLIQLSLGERHVLLFQTKEGTLQPPSLMKKLLCDPTVQKGFCGLDGDGKMISNWFLSHSDRTFVSPEEDIDPLNHFSQFGWVELDPRSRGLVVLTRVHLKLELAKPMKNPAFAKGKTPEMTLSRWSRERYSNEMMRYAQIDALATVKLLKNGVSAKEYRAQRAEEDEGEEDEGRSD